MVAVVGDAAEVTATAVTFPEDVDIVDLGGRCLIPGFVDPHTHLCFARRREEEFGLRLSGTPYLEILRQGGGILSSVRAVAEATEDELYEGTRSVPK